MVDGGIYLFYHVDCNLPRISEICRDQINNIAMSGLYHKVDLIYYSLTGEIKDDMKNVRTIFENAGAKYKILRVGIRDRTKEKMTLREIPRKLCGGGGGGGRGSDVFCFLTARAAAAAEEYYLFTRAAEYIKMLRTGEYNVVSVGEIGWWSRADYFLGLEENMRENITGGGAVFKETIEDWIRNIM